MAVRSWRFGTARCHVCNRAGAQGDVRVRAICGWNGKRTHCSGGVMGRATALRADRSCIPAEVN